MLHDSCTFDLYVYVVDFGLPHGEYPKVCVNLQTDVR